jgi:hypothetical protein
MLIAPPTAASSHLSDSDLLTPDKAGRAKHLADCAWCRQRLAVTQAGLSSDEDSGDDFEKALQSGQWLDDFTEISHGLVLPDQVREVMAGPTAAGDVEPGQLWRVTWKDRHLMVAVIEVDDWQVLSAPVTTDIRLADEFTLLVPETDSPLATDLAIWIRASSAFPLFVFDRQLGTLPAVGAARVSGRTALRQLNRAYLASSVAPANLPVGRPLTDNDVDRLAMHNALQEQADWFSSASAGLIDSDGVLIGLPAAAEDRGPARPLDVVLRDSGLELSELSARTGLDMPRLLDLARPGASASPQEIAAIEGATGTSASIAGATQQARAIGALAEVSRPAWRAARLRWTTDHEPNADAQSPVPIVQRLLQYTLAARTVRQAPERSGEQDRMRRHWRDCLAMILSEYQ